jgi:hypothetical protein
MANPLNFPQWLIHQSKSRFVDLFSENYFKRKPTIMIDGGLGSQMMGWIKYHVAQEMYNNTKVELDLSYFLSTQSTEVIVGLTKWEWELDQYGIDLKNLHPHTKPFLADISYEKRAKFEFPIFQKMMSRSWKHLFPISARTDELSQRINLPKDYGVIHLRRGDYLQVGSKIIHEASVNKLLEKINGLLPRDLLIVSDSEISNQTLNTIKKVSNVNNIEKIIGGDMHAVHGLMRQAKILIASNSTYSMSAALTMTSMGTTVFPTNFYGSLMPNLNTNFNSLANWNLHGDFEEDHQP